jgi:hypothetical protein
VSHDSARKAFYDQVHGKKPPTQQPREFKTFRLFPFLKSLWQCAECGKWQGHGPDSCTTCEEDRLVAQQW